MKPEIKKWMEMAETDYKVASHLFETYYPKPYEIICYHCQQAAEKAIKALILSKETSNGLPKVHDLSFLLNQLKNQINIEEKYYDYADTLTPYGVSARYPNELFLEEHNAETALKITKEMLEWIKNII